MPVKRTRYVNSHEIAITSCCVFSTKRATFFALLDTVKPLVRCSFHRHPPLRVQSNAGCRWKEGQQTCRYHRIIRPGCATRAIHFSPFPIRSADSVRYSYRTGLYISSIRTINLRVEGSASSMNKKSSCTCTIVVFVVAVNFMVWWLSHPTPAPEPEWHGKFRALSFNPSGEQNNPRAKIYPSAEQVWQDIRFLRDKTEAVRTYSSLDGLEAVPGQAAALNLKVIAGAWLDRDLARNEREIENLITNANRYSTIKRVIVGNEAVLRGDLTVKQAISYLDRVRIAVHQPIGIAEPWHVFLHNPALVDHVDFIAIHVLPYWERISFKESIGWVLDRYQQIKKAFPGKAIMISEVGWPSHGERVGRAKPGQTLESIFLRRFLNLAELNGIDYCIMEAFDQPWKVSDEGVVGAHWGIWDRQRRPKLALTGLVNDKSLWLVQFMATLPGVFPVWFYLRRRFDQPLGARAFFALLLQTTSSALVWMFFTPLTGEFLRSETVAWSILIPLQVGLLIVVLVNGFEMSEMLWPKGLKRSLKRLQSSDPARLPKVSIHVPICKEPPEMVRETLLSLSALDYPCYEVLVIDNNNPHPELWQPVEGYCRQLGERFRFFHLETHSGYKAGALNFALSHTAADAAIIAVVDSDYVVSSDWLRDIVPHFEQPGVGIVQAPQDHRDWQGNAFKTMINWEYSGFFEIGMVHRNERNAIIQHGTMTLIRRTTLEQVGRWGEWCICEDAELGLRVIQAGQEALYIKESFGRGLTPDSFAGYRRQRFRWAYGAVQIMRHHWRIVAPWNRRSPLTFGQRYHFFAGWIPWLGDSLNYVTTIVSLLWSFGILVAPRYFGLPIYLFLLPMLGGFVFKLIHFLWLYKARVPCGLMARLGAAIAGLSLAHTISIAMLTALFSKSRPFLRTPKCENRPALIRGLLMAREELIMALLLWTTAALILMHQRTDNIDAVMWVAVLIVQSLPYLASLVLSMASSFRGMLPRLCSRLRAVPAAQQYSQPSR